VDLINTNQLKPQVLTLGDNKYSADKSYTNPFYNNVISCE